MRNLIMIIVVVLSMLLVFSGCKKEKTDEKVVEKPKVVAEKVNPEEFIKTIQKGDTRKVVFFLKKGVDINYKDKNEGTPIMHAIGWKQDYIVDLLLEKKADLTPANKDGMSILHFALTEGSKAVTKKVIAAGAPLNVKNSYGITPLMYASGKGGKAKPEIVHLLVKKGAEINIQDNDGSTAIMYAAGKGRFKTVKILLDAGADITIENKLGRDAKYYADQVVSKDADKIRDLLKNYKKKK